MFPVTKELILFSRLLSPTWFQWMRDLFTDHIQTTLRCKYIIQSMNVFIWIFIFWVSSCSVNWQTNYNYTDSNIQIQTKRSRINHGHWICRFLSPLDLNGNEKWPNFVLHLFMTGLGLCVTLKVKIETRGSQTLCSCRYSVFCCLFTPNASKTCSPPPPNPSAPSWPRRPSSQSREWA